MQSSRTILLGVGGQVLRDVSENCQVGWRDIYDTAGGRVALADGYIEMQNGVVEVVNYNDYLSDNSFTYVLMIEVHCGVVSTIFTYALSGQAIRQFVKSGPTFYAIMWTSDVNSDPQIREGTIIDGRLQFESMIYGFPSSDDDRFDGWCCAMGISGRKLLLQTGMVLETPLRSPSANKAFCTRIRSLFCIFGSGIHC